MLPLGKIASNHHSTCPRHELSALPPKITVPCHEASPLPPVPVIPLSPYNPLITPSFRHSPPRLPSDQPWRFPSPSHLLHASLRVRVTWCGHAQAEESPLRRKLLHDANLEGTLLISISYFLMCAVSRNQLRRKDLTCTGSKDQDDHRLEPLQK